MLAVVLHGKGDIRVERRPRPVVGHGELLLRITTAGVCGTDVAEVTNGPSLTPVHHRHPFTGHEGPVTLGHEFAGVVVEAGPGTETQIGAHVASGSGVACGHCRACTAGKTNLCSTYWTVGFHVDGGLAEYCVVPESVCVAFDTASLTDDGAALAQPMSIAVHAVRVGNLLSGARTLVIGAGGIGMFLIAAIKHVQPDAHVVVIEPDAYRRKVAVEMGCDMALAPTENPPGPFDTVFEVSGTVSGLTTSIASVARGGTIVLVGIQRSRGADLEVLRKATLDEIALVGTSAHVVSTDFPVALEILSARSDWSAIAPTVGTLWDCAAQLEHPAGDRPIKSLFSPQADTARAAGYRGSTLPATRSPS